MARKQKVGPGFSSSLKTWSMFSFYKPQITPENLWFSDVFRVYKNGMLTQNGLISNWYLPNS